MREAISDDLLQPACRKAGTDDAEAIVDRALYLYLVLENADELIESEGYNDPPPHHGEAAVDYVEGE